MKIVEMSDELMREVNEKIDAMSEEDKRLLSGVKDYTMQLYRGDGLVKMAIMCEDGSLAGFLSYAVNYAFNYACSFAMANFRRDLGWEFITTVTVFLKKLLEEKHNRIIWWCVDDNPFIRAYKIWCKKNHGQETHMRECAHASDGGVIGLTNFELLKSDLEEKK